MKTPTIISATFKQSPADFIVTERMDIDFDGAGEHLWLNIKKINMNTVFVARLLSKWAEIPVRDVGYSGLKDRHAETYQWYSLRLPKKTAPSVDFNDFIADKLQQDEKIEILQSHWHGRKLNRGTHKSNYFTITLRDVQGKVDDIEAQLSNIAAHGVPNYFGEQRFGHDGGNLTRSQDFFDKIINSAKPYKPHKKDLERHGMLISATRSHLFNEILALRVANHTWDKGLTGDVFNLNGTGSVFTAQLDDEIRARLDAKDIHPTISLYGMGDNKATDDALALENQVFNDVKYNTLIQGLQKVGVKASRRATRLLISDMNWQWIDGNLELNFELPKGAFATVVLYALAKNLNEPTRRQV